MKPMLSNVTVALVKWLGESYGHYKVKVEEGRISCAIDQDIFLVVEDVTAESLKDTNRKYYAGLYANSEAEPIRLANLSFSGGWNPKHDEETVINSVDDMLTRHCQSLLPKDKLVYKALNK